MEDVLHNIYVIRKNKRISQADIATELAMDGSNYGRLERGDSELTYAKLAKIAEVFKMRTIDIITYPEKYVLSQNEDKRKRIMVEIELSDKEYKSILTRVIENEKQ